MDWNLIIDIEILLVVALYNSLFLGQFCLEMFKLSLDFEFVLFQDSYLFKQRLILVNEGFILIDEF